MSMSRLLLLQSQERLVKEKDGIGESRGTF